MKNKKKNFIDEMDSCAGMDSKSEEQAELFDWKKNVAPVRQPQSGNMHRRSTMQTKAPKFKSDMGAESAQLRAKRK